MVNRNVRSEALREALKLLTKARICHRVLSCSANGISLDAHIKENRFKVIFLDVGLVSASMKLTFLDQSFFDDVRLMNEGGIAEQIVGQLLRTISPFYMDPALFYWVREKTGAKSEVDYVVQHQMDIIPIEVKAGTTDTLRSLHTLMKMKKLKRAVRFNADSPRVTEVNTKDHLGERIRYELMSLPLYLTEQINRFLS